LANQLLRLHAERSGDLLDRHITQIVPGFEWEKHHAMLIVPKPQVFVLARHDFVSVAFKKSSHLPSTNGRQRKPFLFSHYARSIRFAFARAHASPRIGRTFQRPSETSVATAADSDRVHWLGCRQAKGVACGFGNQVSRVLAWHGREQACLGQRKCEAMARIGETNRAT
jgi:hypothetical protein